jgi:hypothetical protein
VSETVRSAEPASRAGVLASFFVIAYLGMGLPSIALSLVIPHTRLRPSLIGFASVLAIGAATAVVAAVRTHGRPVPGPSPSAREGDRARREPTTVRRPQRVALRARPLVDASGAEKPGGTNQKAVLTAHLRTSSLL